MNNYHVYLNDQPSDHDILKLIKQINALNENIELKDQDDIIILHINCKKIDLKNPSLLFQLINTIQHSKMNVITNNDCIVGGLAFIIYMIGYERKAYDYSVFSIENVLTKKIIDTDNRNIINDFYEKFFNTEIKSRLSKNLVYQIEQKENFFIYSLNLFKEKYKMGILTY
jgi:hypothetical protein